VKPILWVAWFGTLVVAAAASHQLTMARIGSGQPDAADLRAALSSRDWLERGAVVSAHMARLDAGGLAATLDVVEDRGRWMTQDELRLFMVAWARTDAAQAFGEALEWPESSRSRGASSALYAWALQDPHAAQRAMKELKDPSLRPVLMDRLVAAWVRGVDKRGAAEFVAGLKSEKNQKRYAYVLALELYAGGSDALISWVDELLSGSRSGFGRLVFAEALDLLAQDDPMRAAQWTEQHLGSPHGDDGVSMVGRLWVDSEPEASLGWLRELAPGPTRDRAVALTFRRWLRSAPIAAENWLASQPVDRSVDSARALLIRKLAPTSPDSAVEVMERISDPLFKEESAVQIAWAWRQIDEAAANAWVEQFDLSDAAKALIMQEGRPPKRFDRLRQDSDPAAQGDLGVEHDAPDHEPGAAMGAGATTHPPAQEDK